MARFRYDTSGSWFKGNTHIHSTASDGGKTFAQLGQMYKEAGYDFLFRTDHWVASNVAADTEAAPLLWLDGIELDGHDRGGSYYHVVCLGRVEGIQPAKGLVAAMETAREQGAFIILAHPHWTGNTFDDATRYGFDAVETYNHVCRWLNGKHESGPYWHAALKRFPNTLGLAVDDAHIRPEHPTWNGGWIMLNAPSLSRDTVWDALRRGNFYSTCGPLLHSLACVDGLVSFTSSPIQFARLVGPDYLGERIGQPDAAPMSEGSFRIPSDWPYLYLEIEDAAGRRAWTNPLFVAET